MSRRLFLMDPSGGSETVVARIEKAFRRPKPGLVQRLLSQSLRDVWRDATRMPTLGATLFWADEDETP
jgi:hypothetical protein